MTGIFSTLTVIDPNGLMCQLCRLWSILIGTCIEFLTVKELEWLNFWFYRMWLTLFGSYVDLSIAIDLDFLKYRLFPMWSTLIGSCVDCVNWDRLFWFLSSLIGSSFISVDRPWRWLSHVMTLSTVIDPKRLMYRLCRLRFSDQLIRLWSTLKGSYVKSVRLDWPWLTHVSTLSAVIPMIGSYVHYVGFDRPWLAHVSTKLSVIDPERLVFRLCRLWLTLIDTFVNFRSIFLWNESIRFWGSNYDFYGWNYGMTSNFRTLKLKIKVKPLSLWYMSVLAIKLLNLTTFNVKRRF